MVRLFKQLSIDSLLKFWALVTVFAVVGMSSIAFYDHHLFLDGQETYQQKIIPLEHEARELNQLTTTVTAKQQQMLYLLDSTSELFFESSTQFHREFQSHLSILKQTPIESESALVLREQIQVDYQQFGELDKQFGDLLKRQQQLHTLIEEKSKQVDSRYQRVHKSLSLLNQHEGKNTLNTRDWGDDIFQFQHVYPHLMLLYRELLQQNDERQTLEGLKGEISTNIDKAIAVNRRLNDIVKLNPDLKTELVPLLEDAVWIVRLIFDGPDSIFQLKVKENEIAKELRSIQHQSLAAATKMVEDIGLLVTAVERESSDNIQSLSEAVTQNFWFTIGIACVLLICLFIVIIPISRRINQPLTDIKQAMHALSDKQFDTRIGAIQGNHEFSELAKDFNTFAENTQYLIADLADAKLSIEANEQRLLAILDGVPEAILTLSQQGVITASNPAADKVLNAQEGQLVNKEITDFFNVRVPSLEAFIRLFEDTNEFEGIDLKGNKFHLEASITPIQNQKDDVWVCVITDVSALKLAQSKLKEAKSELNAIFENALVGIAYIKERSFLRVNKKFEELFGYSREMIEGKSTRIVYQNTEAFNNFGEMAYSVLEQENTFQADVQVLKQDGSAFWCSVTSKAIHAGKPEEGSIWLFDDITLQRANDQRLRRLASFDSLTNLPNRTLFTDRLEHAIAKANRKKANLAVFFLDLDNFKNINDSLGHKMGDLLLVDVAKRLKQCIREEDTVARLGGDEFTIVLENISSTSYVGKIADKILHSVSQPYLLDKLEINISPSIGISLFPSDGNSIEQLVKNADAAMYHAKKLGRNNFQFYSAAMNAKANLRLEMESALRKATENDEFYLHFQPQIDLASGKIVGAEALLRWSNDTFGNVSPAEFVPILEESGLITEVGEQVLRKSCQAYKRIEKEVTDDFVIAVNLSGRQFKGGNLANFVKQTLQEFDMAPHNLELEITESILMEDTQLAIKTLRELSEQGVYLAVDDFGTGYSSLAYLKQFPLNVLKIDRSFVSDVTIDDDDAAIVDAILAMSRRLNLDVVAEGIENTEHLAFLQSHGCQRGQGFHFSKPLDIVRLIEFIHQSAVVVT
jgi:diguanylate cyclase (GGDEF)-like protein/PAS domain S-box-containing protein